MRPRSIPSDGAPGETRFKETLPIGRVELVSRAAWSEVLGALKVGWPGASYDLLARNCNHFSDAMLRSLNPEWALPKRLNRAAGVGSSVVGTLFFGTGKRK